MGLDDVRYPSMAGYRRTALATFAAALMDLVRESEHLTSRQVKWRHARDRASALAFFDPENEHFVLFCVVLGFDAVAVAAAVRGNYESEAFRQRIRGEAAVEMLFAGTEARTGVSELCPEEESDACGISSSMSEKSGTRAQIEWGID